MQKDKKVKQVCFLTTVSSVSSVSTNNALQCRSSCWGFLLSPEFKESVLTPEQIANNLRDEMKRLKKRREFRGQVGSSFVCLGGTFNFQFNNILVWWENLSLSSHLIFFSRVPLPPVLHPPLQNLWWRRTWWRDRWIIFHSPEDLNSLSWTWGVFIVDRKFSFPWVGASILINHHSHVEALNNRRAPLVHHQQAPHHLPPPLSLTSPSSPSSRWAWSVRPSIIEETHNLPQLIQELMTMECDL